MEYFEVYKNWSYFPSSAGAHMVLSLLYSRIWVRKKIVWGRLVFGLALSKFIYITSSAEESKPVSLIWSM